MGIKIDDSIFWDIIGQFLWGEHGDYRSELTNRLIEKYGHEVMIAVKNMAIEKFNCLYKILDKFDNVLVYEGYSQSLFDLGDDSFNDLVWHIIGLGKTEYDAVMADPSLAFKRAKKIDFVESFFYCINWIGGE